jgi:hypothetical protein
MKFYITVEIPVNVMEDSNFEFPVAEWGDPSVITVEMLLEISLVIKSSYVGFHVGLSYRTRHLSYSI